MFLRELFEPGVMTYHLRQAALDYLTPFLSQNVPFVTIDQMIDALRHGQFGLVITRSMVMDLLDPEQVKAVSKIEGDHIYLNNPDEAAREVGQEDAEKDQDHVADMAVDQVKKTLTKKTPKAPAAPAPAPAPAGAAPGGNA
jgi:hypothetical protein